jgi:hypothetical protein
MDPDIAPLARRLAEENNVDWRRLEGSGTDGRIVERDVLDFLARVMAGEEDTDPTPEPLPEGMEAWPEEQAPGAAEAARPADGVGPPTPTEPAAAGAPEDDELLLAGDDLAGDALAGPAGAEEEALLLGDEEAASGPAGAGPDEEVPDLFAGSDAAAPAAAGSPDLFLDEEEAAEGGAEDETFDFGGLPGAVREPGPTGPAPSEAQPPFEAEPPAAPEPAAEAQPGPPPEVEEPDLSAAVDVDTADAAASPPDEPAPGPDVAAAPGAAAAEPPVPDALAPAQAAARQAAPELPLARTRTVLRRHVDVGPAFEVRRSVALEAGREDLPLAALLLAAARRAAGRLDASRPAVAVAGPAGRPSVVAPDAGGLAEIAAEIDAAGQDHRDDPEADLWIVDLSDAGVDEALLDADAAQLVLGRVLTDRDDGSRRATLSLAADVPLERGTAFLIRVADLLEQPLRLLA